MSSECNCMKCSSGQIVEHTAPDGQVWRFPRIMMHVCSICGNKRCPHATDHELDCTGSNEPGQKGSAYE